LVILSQLFVKPYNEWTFIGLIHLFYFEYFRLSVSQCTDELNFFCYYR
jgi:hypothetical protein